ncbi:MAG: class I SAM-dependent methyltransferase, partial [Bacteroidota bacterium]
MPYFLLLGISLLTLACQGQATEDASKTPDDWPEHYQAGPTSYDGTGKYYLGREISEVMGHFGAAWLERPERVREERTDLVLANLELTPQAVVADIGAGSGYYAFKIASLIPEGKVFAVDIQPEMLDMIRQKRKTTGITNVVPLRGSIQDPRLPSDTLDLVFMVDVYHEFSHPREMMRALFKSLKSGGRVILLEYRAEDPKVPIKPRHKMT